MKAVIVCVSVSHGNTRRVADSMAEVLGAKVVSPEEADVGELGQADIVGFGSGVFYGRLHPRLTGFVRSLPGVSAPSGGERRGAFVFATSGLPELPLVFSYARPLSQLLQGKGFEVDATFSCRALDTWAPFKPLGGLNKHRPNAADIAAARAFAGGLGRPRARTRAGT
ncbi:flavodoxin domain-containing protein [Streptomyces varsoviensis]|uniref:flavodoxin domain-containing protein n=1 Tax=Streptomyces varsoviensis TaxID=67373 RepID=UPI0033EBC852